MATKKEKTREAILFSYQGVRMWGKIVPMKPKTFRSITDLSELPRPIEVGASCFNHHSFVNDIRYRSLTRCPQA